MSLSEDVAKVLTIDSNITASIKNIENSIKNIENDLAVNKTDIATLKDEWSKVYNNYNLLYTTIKEWQDNFMLQNSFNKAKKYELGSLFCIGNYTLRVKSLPSGVNLYIPYNHNVVDDINDLATLFSGSASATALLTYCEVVVGANVFTPTVDDFFRVGDIFYIDGKALQIKYKPRYNNKDYDVFSFAQLGFSRMPNDMNDFETNSSFINMRKFVIDKDFSFNNFDIVRSSVKELDTIYPKLFNKCDGLVTAKYSAGVKALIDSSIPALKNISNNYIAPNMKNGSTLLNGNFSDKFVYSGGMPTPMASRHISINIVKPATLTTVADFIMKIPNSISSFLNRKVNELGTTIDGSATPAGDRNNVEMANASQQYSAKLVTTNDTGYMFLPLVQNNATGNAVDATYTLDNPNKADGIFTSYYIPCYLHGEVIDITN